MSHSPTKIGARIPMQSGMNAELEKTALDFGTHRNEIISQHLVICHVMAIEAGLDLTSWTEKQMREILERYDDGDLQAQMKASVKDSRTTSIFDLTRAIGRMRHLYNSIGALYARLRRRGA